MRQNNKKYQDSFLIVNTAVLGIPAGEKSAFVDIHFPNVFASDQLYIAVNILTLVDTPIFCTPVAISKDHFRIEVVCEQKETHEMIEIQYIVQGPALL